MNSEIKYSIVITTVGSEEQASKLALLIVSNRLGACVQLQRITSFYVWKGESCKEEEVLLLIKTRTELYEKLAEFISQNHSYETPEIVRVDIADGSAAYLSWVGKMTHE